MRSNEEVEISLKHVKKARKNLRCRLLMRNFFSNSCRLAKTLKSWNKTSLFIQFTSISKSLPRLNVLLREENKKISRIFEKVSKWDFWPRKCAFRRVVVVVNTFLRQIREVKIGVNFFFSKKKVNEFLRKKRAMGKYINILRYIWCNSHGAFFISPVT